MRFTTWANLDARAAIKLRTYETSSRSSSLVVGRRYLMTIRRAFLLSCCLVGIAFTQVATTLPGQTDQISAGPASTFTVQGVGRKIKIVAYGDIRFTDPTNSDRSSPTARSALVQKIAEEKPDALLVSGDIPYRGSHDDDWATVDAEIKPIWDAKIRVYPALGNHELVGDDKRALANWWKRFPDLKGHRWYSVTFGNCYFIVLDSNSTLLPGTQQWDWANRELTHLPAQTDFVFIVMHHPPYTDSHEHTIPGRGHSARRQEQEFGAMLEQLQPKLRPRLICIAGHVHNYERFEKNGVTYIVSGGGGATPYLFNRSSDDKYQGGSDITYHYLRFEVDGNTLKATMVKLDFTDGRHPTFENKDAFELTAKEAAPRDK